MPTPINCQHADVEVVQDDFQTSIIMSDAFEQIFENGVILKNLDTPQRHPVRPVDG